MSASKFFSDNLSRLPKSINGLPTDSEKQNLYAGLLAMARQLDKLEAEQKQIAYEVRQLLQAR